MHHKYAAFIRFINVCYDILILNLVLAIVVGSSFKRPIGFSLISESKFIILWFNFLWMTSSTSGRLYLYRNLIYFKEGVRRSAVSFLFFIFLEISLDFLFFGNSLTPRGLLIQFLIAFGFLFWAARLLFYVLKKIYALELFSGRRVFLVGELKYVERVKQLINSKKELGFIYSGNIQEDVFDVDYESAKSFLFEAVKNEKAEEVFFIKTAISNEHLYNLIQELDKITIRVRIIPDFFNFYTKPQNLSFIGNIPLLSLRREPLESLFNRMLKRGFDIIFSIFIIIGFISWIFPILAILIKLESKGPVFFRQKRSGRDSKPFWCYKFRSMYTNMDSDILKATKSDIRITRIGSFIRKTSIDELPQFFNVLFGNMSIVGPRPHMLSQTMSYSTLVDKYMIRHFVKPGITGWAQVNGYRGEIAKFEDLEKRVEHDIWYLENWAFLLDVQVILLTIYYVIVGQKNAY
jgi:putative colanic acid biosynthesis UDP-glucose lipid carrier transferase